MQKETPAAEEETPLAETEASLVQQHPSQIVTPAVVKDITIKARLGDKRLRWSSPADQLSLPVLRTAVQAQFGVEQTRGLCWIDSDGYSVSISIEADLQEAVRESTNALWIEVDSRTRVHSEQSVPSVEDFAKLPSFAVKKNSEQPVTLLKDVAKLPMNPIFAPEKSDLLLSLEQQWQAITSSTEQMDSHQPAADSKNKRNRADTSLPRSRESISPTPSLSPTTEDKVQPMAMPSAVPSPTGSSNSISVGLVQKDADAMSVESCSTFATRESFSGLKIGYESGSSHPLAYF